MATSNYSIAFYYFMTDLCISLFSSIAGSKFRSLLITDNVFKSNRIQREFLFYEAIHSHSLVPASSHPRQKNKPFQTVLPLSLRRWRC
jgi:hypothetical protein